MTCLFFNFIAGRDFTDDVSTHYLIFGNHPSKTIVPIIIIFCDSASQCRGGITILIVCLSLPPLNCLINYNGSFLGDIDRSIRAQINKYIDVTREDAVYLLFRHRNSSRFELLQLTVFFV